MADRKISELAATTTINGGDTIPYVQSGGTYKIAHTNYLKNDITTITAATYTVQAHDEVVEGNSVSNNIAVTLPDRAANAGRYILVRKIASANTITISRAGTDVITRASLTSVTLTSDGDFWVFFAGSTRWELVDGVESGSNFIKYKTGIAHIWDKRLTAGTDSVWTFPFTIVTPTSDNFVASIVAAAATDNFNGTYRNDASTTSVSFAGFVADTAGRIAANFYIWAKVRWYA